jgi:hypothetical protein
MSGKPKLMLHIGRHKCGTSSLQRFLSANAGVLERHGISYPVLHRQPYAHHPVAHAYGGNGVDTGAFWQVVAASSAAIVSSEAFQNIDPASLAPDLDGFDVTILAYFREPLDYLLSSYAQKVKAGNTAATLEDYAAHFHVPYHDFAFAWQAAFPQANLRFRLFESAHLSGQDVRRDFLLQCGLAPAALDDFAFAAEDGNPSIGGDMLEFVRALVPDRAAWGENWWLLYEAVQRLALADARYRARPPMPAAMQDAVRQRHQVQVAGFERDFLPSGQRFTVKSFPEGPFCAGISREAAEEIRQALTMSQPSLEPLWAAFWPAIASGFR